VASDESRRIAVNFAKPPDLLRQPQERRSMIIVVKAIRDAQHALTDHLAAERPDAKSVA
jgi:hypothetical protein